MLKKVIDSHIHLDCYEKNQQEQILYDLDTYHIDTLIAVSMNHISAKKTLSLAKQYSVIEAAIGYHPEQSLPSEDEITSLLRLIDEQQSTLTAIGEVGLPYYLRQENPDMPLEPYIDILEMFIKKAGELNVPIALHAVYDDAPIVCSLLEKYSIEKAHFHWFKGDKKTMERMIQNGYVVSFTPDIIYHEKRQPLIKQIPLSHMMVETDGPWPFDGPFKSQMTHPKMIHQIIRKIAQVKRMPLEEVYAIIYQTTKQFYLGQKV
ncbi:MAG TPA: TatD family hydrolase [Cerasibacillus sp.]|uniref:TatD family hydrolase n=1 Tax=Cerasibacillus sp. TaxID=2498711 RepID=UPI002F40D92A